MGKIFIGECDRKEILKNCENIYLVGNDIDGIETKEKISFSDTIMYKYYYKWLTEISKDVTIILNGILRRRKRNSLEYNCIRQYCQQAGEVIIFEDFPIIDRKEDFMILYDMVSDVFREDYENVEIFEDVYFNVNLDIKRHDVELDLKCVKEYEELKEKTISQVKKDADIIPRRLLKFSEKCKAKFGKFDRMDILKPHMNVAVSQLKVDKYYWGELKKKESEIFEIREKVRT